jgi:hypothetical protein
MAKRKTLAKKGKKNRKTRRNLLKRGGGLGRDVGSMLTFGVINGTDKYNDYKFIKSMDKIRADAEKKAKKSGAEYTEEEKRYLKQFGQYDN